MIALGNLSDLALTSVLLTCIGFQLSRPRGVGIPIRVNSRATPENESMPASLNLNRPRCPQLADSSRSHR
jgi:hypothetical protein